MTSFLSEFDAFLRRDNRVPARQILFEAAVQLSRERTESPAASFEYLRQLILSGRKRQGESKRDSRDILELARRLRRSRNYVEVNLHRLKSAWTSLTAPT